MIKTQLSNLQILRFDNGEKYDNNELSVYFQENGMYHDLAHNCHNKMVL